MKLPFYLFAALVVAHFSTLSAFADNILRVEREEISKAHQQWWNDDLVWKFEDLPSSGIVDRSRIPYSGHIYPDRAGGCTYVLNKYDRAFHAGRGLATSFERRDISIHKKQTTTTRRGGLFGFRRVTVSRRETPHWAGHCNGWTAAAIRHAEPVNNVTRNGVTFTPADIKGLLAELYVYCQIEPLGGGSEGAVNPAMLHVILANWIGLGGHPVGMDKSLGEEVWNYPIYAYTSSHSMRGERRVEVKTNLGFVNYTNREYNRAPQMYNFLYFHYSLDLDSEGRITGGDYFYDSNRIDLLWAPLQPTAGGKPGNEQGNPHLNVAQVLSLWRDSVPAEKRSSWYNVNPYPDDAIVDDEEEVTEEAIADNPAEESSEESDSSTTGAEETTTEEQVPVDTSEVPESNPESEAAPE